MTRLRASARGPVVPLTLFRVAPPQVQLKSPVVLLDTAKSRTAAEHGECRVTRLAVARVFFWLWLTGRRAPPSGQERKIPCRCFPEIERDDDTDRGRGWAERIRRARRARTDRRERDLSDLSAARRLPALHRRRSVGRPRRQPQGLYDRR